MWSLVTLRRALLTVLSTLPGYHTHPFLGRILFGLDTMVVVLFTLEYLARVRPFWPSSRALLPPATYSTGGTCPLSKSAH